MSMFVELLRIIVKSRTTGVGVYMKEIEMWVDGSSIKKEGGFHGGVGCVLIYKGKEKHLSIAIEDGTNNLTELLAPLIGLEQLKEKCRVTIYSDSMYVINCITKWVFGWERRNWITTSGEVVKNKDTIQKLYNLCKYHEIEWVKVKAHSEIYYNDLADSLATKASASLKEGV